MTAVEWLLQELEKVNYHPTEAMIMYAKKLEMQQMEISDEYIHERAEQHSKTSSNKTIAKTYFKHGARWYREHLRQRL